MPNPFRTMDSVDDLLYRLSRYADDGATGRVIQVTPEGVASITSRRALDASPYMRSAMRLEAPLYVSPAGVASHAAPVRNDAGRIDEYLRQFFDGDSMPLDITR